MDVDKNDAGHVPPAVVVDNIADVTENEITRGVSATRQASDKPKCQYMLESGRTCQRVRSKGMNYIY
jgi:hypothetical protein